MIIKKMDNSSQQAESVNSEKAELFTVKTVTVPPTIFTTKDEFVTTWFTWKNEFLAYLRNIDKTEDEKQMWGVMLLNRMGPVGQKIHRTFPFHADKNAEEDICVLINKFDIYCLYGDKKRGGKDIDEYINDLKLIAIAQNYIDPIRIVKEKIIQDISIQRFTGKAALLIESKGENLIPYLQSLDFFHVTLFWKQCENLMTQKIEETSKQDSFYDKSTTECTHCDTEHNQNRYTAWGHQFRLRLSKLCSAQRNKPKQFNHYTNKVKYISACTKCGMDHIQSQCPAYGELCTKCGKRDHFSFKCQTPFVNNCSKCGMNHVASMCPAQSQTCHHCNRII